jgi:hypothetical protein
MWNGKAKVIPVIIGVAGTIQKSLRQYSAVPCKSPQHQNLSAVLELLYVYGWTDMILFQHIVCRICIYMKLHSLIFSLTF